MKSIVILLLFFLQSIAVFSTNYYCDPVNGSMSNNGSLASPWGSLEAVFNQGVNINGGDKLILLNGNHGFPKILGINSSNVEIIPQNGHTPIINRLRIGNTTAATNWLLNGLTIQSENVNQYPINLVELYPNATNITVINCTITSNQNTSSWNRNDWRTKANNGILSKGTGHKFNYNTITNVAIGLSMLSDFSQFIGNTIQYFTIDGIRGLGNDCSYIGNEIKDNISVYYYSENHYDGFQSFSTTPSVGNGTVSNVIIKQNTIINCTDNTRQFRGSMQGIGCFDGMYHNWTIENNVIIVDNWHGITLAGATNCRIINNTVIDPYDISYQDPNDPQQFGNVGPVWIKITAHKTDGGVNSGTLSTNNTIINYLTSTMQNDNNIGTVSNNILLGTSSNYASHFANPPTYDLHLIASSSAIDAGTNSNAPNIDIENTARPQGNGIDIGAYEFQSGCNISFQISTSSSSICSGESLTLTTNSNSTATWNNNVQDNVAFNPTTSQTYTATVTNGNCSHQEQITINVTPTPSFNIISGLTGSSICSGEQLTLTTNSNSTATWDNNVQDNVAFNPTATQTYTATVTNGNCSHQEQIMVNLVTTPHFTISAWDTTLCQGETSMITASGSSFPIIWSNNITNGIPFTPQTTNTYIATTDNGTCVYTDSITVVVNPIPTINIVTVNNILIADNTNGSLQWFRNGSLLNGETNDTLIYTTNGNYEVTIIDNNGCSSTSNQLQIQDVGISQNETSLISIIVSSQNIQFVSNSKIQEISIYNLNGQIVAVVENKKIVNIESLRSGIYLAKVRTNKNIQSFKFFVE